MVTARMLALLKGQPEALLAAISLVAVLAAIGAGVPPLSAYGAMAIAGLMYHIHKGQAYRHARALGQMKIEQSSLKVEEIKARYRQLQKEEQPSLPLGSDERLADSSKLKGRRQ